MAIEDGRLPNETEPNLDGVDLTGFSDNYWIGLSLLHTLFVKEHNAICDYLKGSHTRPGTTSGCSSPRGSSTRRCRRRSTRSSGPRGSSPTRCSSGRCTPTGTASCRAGCAQKFGHVGTEMIGGVVGSNQEPPRRALLDHRGVRLGLPAAPAAARRLRDPRPPQRPLIDETDFEPIQGARHAADDRRVRARRTSTTRSGSPTRARSRLHNHPRALNNHVRLTGDRVDLGTIDILRDRERGVRRYNDFREALRKPRIEQLRGPHRQRASGRRRSADVYDGDIDKVDLQVGLLAEPLPPGFGFSDTAFRIFILMASRRLKSRPLLHQRLLARGLHA